MSTAETKTESKPEPTTTETRPTYPKGEEHRGMSLEQFNERLTQSTRAGRTALLKEFGVESEEALKELLGNERKLREAQMTEQQRLQAQVKDLEPKAKRVSEYEKEIEEYLQLELKSMTDAQRAQVERYAPKGVAAKLKFIAQEKIDGFLKPGSTQSAASTETSEKKKDDAATPATPPREAATTLAPSGPTVKPPTTMNPYEHYQKLLTNNPRAAANFYNLNKSKIEAARPKQ